MNPIASYLPFLRESQMADNQLYFSDGQLSETDNRKCGASNRQPGLDR